MGSVIGILAQQSALSALAANSTDSSGTVPPSAIAAKKKGNNSNGDLKPFEDAIANTQKFSGLFSLYRKRDSGRLYLEIQPDQLNRNFLGIATLESGLGELGLYSGWPLRSFLFQFRHVHDKVHVVIPNVYFRVDRNDPQQQSLQRSFSDSVLYALKIHSIHPGRKSLLIDLSDLLLGKDDLAGVAQSFPWLIGDSYRPAPEKSYFSASKAFPLNVEIETTQGFSRESNPEVIPDALPDSRGFSLRIRYSFSTLPDRNGYRPRLADDRVGYFIAAYQDLSDRSRDEPFVRYIRRWHLEKQDPERPLSPPKEPIVYWIENAVPLEYRQAIREGILMWNDAFEQAGFEQAIEVRQMPDNAKWDPADVRYNTIRWSNSFNSSIVGLGPSRFNPLTGQILDADIVIDAGSVARVLQKNYGFLAQDNRSFNATPAAAIAHQVCDYGESLPYLQHLALQPHPLEQLRQGGLPGARNRTAIFQTYDNDVCFGWGAVTQAAVGALSLSLMHNVAPNSPIMKDYIHQFLRHLIAHEVGHTLGLRHNFRSSTFLKPEELHNPEITRKQGLIASVMDYAPINLAPQGMPQGDYFSAAVGPYDRWAIEYGYKPLATTNYREEWGQLQQIARRAAEPGLAYAPDEDTLNVLDPDANLWDLSSDSLQYSQWQLENAHWMWLRLDQRYPFSGESYSKLRDRFNVVFSYYVRNARNTTRYIGGERFNRYHRGDPGGRLPFESIPVAKQRQALDLLQRYVFATDAFPLSPELLNRLAPSRWYHWGSYPRLYQLDYPIYNRVLFLQSLVLGELLSSARLARLRDAELKNRPGETLTLPELFDTLQAGIWTEVLQPQPSLKISVLRRGLQYQYTNVLINMTLRDRNAARNAATFPEAILALKTANAPEDARVLARYKLGQLQDAIALSLLQSTPLDITTVAHLEAIQDRIHKALNAPLRSQ